MKAWFAVVLWTVLFAAAFFALTRLVADQWLACGTDETRAMRNCVFAIGNVTFAAIGLAALAWAAGIA